MSNIASTNARVNKKEIERFIDIIISPPSLSRKTSTFPAYVIKGKQEK